MERVQDIVLREKASCLTIHTVLPHLKQVPTEAEQNCAFMRPYIMQVTTQKNVWKDLHQTYTHGHI